ncbi:MAG TPA: hypothetical protein VGM37_11990 [Armatimonadota bacterium]|jgi:hypothetical protein
MSFTDVVYCTVCRKPMPATEPACPSCGADQRAPRSEPARAAPPVQREGHLLINRLIAASEILGGVLGFHMIITAGVGVNAFDKLFVAVLSVSCLLAGAWLWSGKPLGVRVSLVIQAMQSLFFALPALTYVWLAGPAVYLGLYINSESRVGYMYGVFSRAMLGSHYMPVMHYGGFVMLPAVSVHGMNILIGVNLVALAFAAYLLRVTLREK